MRALTWQGNLDVRVTDVPDPQIQEPNDAIIAVTSTAICGSDLHLYGVLGPYLSPGDVLGHEAMGVVTEVGADVTNLVPGDRVVIPFNISCGHCWMCTRGLYAQCETTQVREQGKGAALFGYTSLYGSVPGGQAQFLRVPQAQFGPVKIPADGPDEQYLFLSDVLPTAYQAYAYADTPKDGTLAVLGLGPDASRLPPPTLPQVRSRLTTILAPASRGAWPRTSVTVTSTPGWPSCRSCWAASSQSIVRLPRRRGRPARPARRPGRPGPPRRRPPAWTGRPG